MLGQVDDDASIRFGLPPGSYVRGNEDLLRAVRQRFPESWLVYKPHPDVAAGLRASKLKPTIKSALWDECNSEASLQSLFNQVDRVCTLTSLGGFEALIHGVPVSTWGLPFYAGWGLTDDALEAHPWIQERRRRRLDLETLIHGALVHYPIYISARSGRRCSIDTVLDEINATAHAEAQSMTLEQQVFRWWGAAVSLRRAVFQGRDQAAS